MRIDICERCMEYSSCDIFRERSSSINGGNISIVMCDKCFKSSTGWVKQENKMSEVAKRNEIGVRVDLLYGDFIIEMGKIMSAGAKKYGDNNWRKPGLDGEKSGANHALCHLMEYMEDKPCDYGPRETHLAQVAVNAMFEFYHYRLRKMNSLLQPATSAPVKACGHNGCIGNTFTNKNNGYKECLTCHWLSPIIPVNADGYKPKGMA